MAGSQLSYCGLDCNACEYHAQTGCPGCQAAEGKLFWGECAVAKCCMDMKLEHCGKCAQFPCKTLNEYSYHPEHGDNGKRIADLVELNQAAGGK